MESGTGTLGTLSAGEHQISTKCQSYDYYNLVIFSWLQSPVSCLALHKMAIAGGVVGDLIAVIVVVLTVIVLVVFLVQRNKGEAAMMCVQCAVMSALVV